MGEGRVKEEGKWAHIQVYGLSGGNSTPFP